MNEFVSDLIHSFVFQLLFSLFFYLVGHFIYSFIYQNGKNDIKSFFVKLSLGVISTVVIYAIITTNFLTLYSVIPICVLVYFLFNKDKLTADIGVNLKKIEPSIFIIYSVSLLIISLGTVYLFHYDARLFTHPDLAFYARVGSSLFQNHIEVANHEAFFYGTHSATIYHYFNEWMIALFMNYTSFTSLKTLLLIIFPLLSSLIFTGALNLTNEYVPKISIIQKILLSFLFIAIPGLLSLLMFFVTNLSLNMPYSILHGGIVILKVKIIVILLLLFFKDRNVSFKQLNFLPLSLIPLFWTTQIPSFLGGYLLYFLYLLVARKKIITKNFITLFLPVLLVPFQLSLINIALGSSSGNLWDTMGVGFINSLSELFEQYNSVIGILITITVLVLVVLILLIKFLRKKSHLFLKFKISFINERDKELIIFFVFISIAAIVSFIILISYFNARQILMNLFYPLANIVFFILFLKAFKKYKMVGRLFLSGIFLLITFHLIAFRPAMIQSQIPDHFEWIRSLNRKTTFATDINRGGSIFSLYAKPYGYYLISTEDYKPIRIDIIRNPEEMSLLDRREYDNKVSKQIFYRYMQEKEYLIDDVDSAKVSFLRDFEIDFLLINSHLLSDSSSYVSKLAVDTMFLFDKDVHLIKLKH